MNKLKEFLLRKIDESSIFEMSMKRRAFMNLADSLSSQIAESWVLIRYCSITNTNLDIRSHWCKELAAHIENIMRHRIDSDRRKALEQMLIIELEMNDPEVIEFMTRRKIESESLSDGRAIEKAVKDFCDTGLYRLIDIMSKEPCRASGDELIRYIYEEI